MLFRSTVYKPVPTEAAAAAALAIALVKGTKVTSVNGQTNNGVREVPSVLLKPTWVTKSNINILFTTGFLKKSQVCVGQYKQYC